MPQLSPPVPRDGQVLLAHQLKDHESQTILHSFPPTAPEDVASRRELVLQALQCDVPQVADVTDVVAARGAAEVPDAQRARLREEEVLRLDVAMNDLLRVKTLECLRTHAIEEANLQYGQQHEPHHRLGHGCGEAQRSGEIAARTVLHESVENSFE